MSRIAFAGVCVGVYALWQLICVFIFSLGAWFEGLGAKLLTYSLAYGVFLLFAWVGTRCLPGGFTLKKLVCPRRKFSFRIMFHSLLAWMVGCTAIDLILFGSDIAANNDFSFFLIILPFTLVFTVLQCINEEFIYRMFPAQLLCGGIPDKKSARWVLCVFSGLFFLAPHMTNLEVTSTRAAVPVLAFYFLMGVILMYMSCITGGYESAIGIHIGNNLFCNLLVEPSVTSFPMAALFKNKRPIDGSLVNTLLEIAVPFIFSVLVLRLFDKIPFLVGKASADNHDEVDNVPDAAASAGEEHEETCSDLSVVEPVDAEHSEENTEK